MHKQAFLLMQECFLDSYNSITIVYKGVNCLVFSTPPTVIGANILACHTKRMWHPWWQAGHWFASATLQW